MKRLKFSKHFLIFFLALSGLLSACATNSASDDSSSEDLAAIDRASDEASSSDQQNPEDEFAEFNDQDKNEETKKEEPANDEDLLLSEEEKPKDEPPVVAEEPVVQEPPPVAETKLPETVLTNIKSIQYKANNAGGAVIIDADGPLTYSANSNLNSGRYIIEIPNSKLSDELKKPLLTSEFGSSINKVEASQKDGTNISRISIQLGEGAQPPVVQLEGNSMYIVASAMPQKPKENIQLLSYSSLEEFLSGNMNFSGKKISIETDEMELKDLFKLISEEGGINFIISDGVAGKISVKLRQVPWDQALVMILRAKNLSYSRAGNILRIAKIDDFKKEEDDSIKMANSKKTVAPLKVKLIPISYAKVDDLEKQIKGFLSPRGTIVGDTRTNSVVISDIDENLDRAMKIIQSIDIPPQQVLIEGKIVEASEEFDHQIGVNWAAGGTTTTGKMYTSAGKIHTSLSSFINPGAVSSPSGEFKFNFGTLDILGELDASLQLREKEGLIKILSSPRVLALHNEAAKITQTTEVPIITSQTQNGVNVPQVSYKSAKLELNVTPTITNDGSVIMKVDVNRDILSGPADPVTQARGLNSRNAATKVLVRNGQTAVIGGIYQNDMTENESRVPGLGNIPILGWLFKTKSHTNSKLELMIFLTPRIMGQLDSRPNQEIKSSEEL